MEILRLKKNTLILSGTGDVKIVYAFVGEVGLKLIPCLTNGEFH